MNPESYVEATFACVKLAVKPVEVRPDASTVSVTLFRYVPVNIPVTVTVCPATKLCGLVTKVTTLPVIENDTTTVPSSVPIPTPLACPGLAHIIPLPELTTDAGIELELCVLIRTS
jgi:hypothetical protein